MKKDITGYRILNLTSGDNIIGQVSTKSESSVTLYRPFQMKIITMMDQAGPHNLFRQEALIMRNWLELSEDQKVTIPTNQIVAITNPSLKVSELYDEEMEKEDNPDKMMELLDHLKNSRNDEDDYDDDEEEDENMNYSEDVDDLIKHFHVEISPSDIRDIVSRIIDDSMEHVKGTDDEEDDQQKEEPEDYYDTDKEMFGW